MQAIGKSLESVAGKSLRSIVANSVWEAKILRDRNLETKTFETDVAPVH